MLRPYASADEDELIDVWLASTIPGQPFLPEEYWRAQVPLVRDEYLPVARTWVVEEGGRLVAFVSLFGDLIAGLFTHPEHQGQGHGRALVEHAHAHYDPLFVEVFEQNERAIGFYRRCGFVDHLRQTDELTGLPILVLRLEGPSPRRT